MHNDISQVFGKGLKAKLKKKLDKKIYSKYQKLIFVSKDNLKSFKKEYPEIRNKYLEPVKKDFIYNYINKDLVIEKANQEIEVEFNNEILNFVTVARLVPQKAIDRLINVHKKLLKKELKNEFYVIGDGPEKQKLEKMIKEENITETFHLLGKKENPYPYIKKADYFCLLSEFEGYGMVLEEAKILNKEIIITDTAAREAVEKYPKATILKNNEDAIYDGIRSKILKNNTQKEDNMLEYNNKDIIEKIIKLFEE